MCCLNMEVPRPYSLGYILVLTMHDVMAVNARFSYYYLLIGQFPLIIIVVLVILQSYHASYQGDSSKLFGCQLHMCRWLLG